MIVILGGGLSGCLLAYRLSKLKNCPEFLLIEAKSEIGGNHTWSFHGSDFSLDQFSWLQPFIRKSWDRQEVRFHDFSKCFDTAYHTISADRLREVVIEALGERLILNQSILKVENHQVTLQSGEVISASLIFDARGLHGLNLSQVGYQKFYGLELELEEPHGLDHPMIMDTVCSQADGYRFFYLLPFSDKEILIEDTRYTTTGTVEPDQYESEIFQYCAKNHWKIKNVIRREVGSLPIPMRQLSLPLDQPQLIHIGLCGGFFHPTTGYSVGHAVRVAEKIAQALSHDESAQLTELVSEMSTKRKDVIKNSYFFILLNRMLFLAASPAVRWKIFHRFYRLPSALIFRFYRGELRVWDQIRVLIGKPPVSVFAAIRSLFLPKFPVQTSTIRGSDEFRV